MNVDFPVKDLLHLSLIPTLGSYRIRMLVSVLKSADRIFGASIRELCRIDGFEEATARQLTAGLRDATLKRKAIKQLEMLEKHDALILTFWDYGYPENLRSLYNPPVLLFVKGALHPDDKMSVAIVGTRSVTDYGRVTADRLSGELASRGITIISGMATGIDSFAHWGALKTGGRTVAVLGCGVDIVYPPENNSLYKEIIQKGAVISEFAFGTKPSKGAFPARNRIISGMSLGTVIVEAGKKSGALITAAAALEQNREVFAVPGNIHNKQCEGTNRLIRDGAAKLVQNADDILEELGPQLQKLSASDIPESMRIQLSDNEAAVYKLIGHEPVIVDKLEKQSGIPPALISAPLLTLELKGVIRRLPGNKYVRQ